MIRGDTKKDYEILAKYQQQAVEIKRLKEKIKYLNGELNRYKSMIWLCEKVKDCDKE